MLKVRVQGRQRRERQAFFPFSCLADIASRQTDQTRPLLHLLFTHFCSFLSLIKMPIRQAIADVPRTKSIVLGVGALLVGSAVFYFGTAVSGKDIYLFYLCVQ